MSPRALLVAAVLACSATAARADPPVVIFDARADPPQAQPAAAEAALLERVVRPEARRAWRGADVCSDAFEVIGRVRGSFTRPGARQSAVLYRFCDVGRQTGMSGVAVLEAGRVAAHVVYEGGGEDAIAALPDVDEDGLSEIAIAGTGTGQGTMDRGMSILELGPRGVKKLGFFAIYHDDCGTEHRRPAERAAVLYATPGPAPRFFVDRFTRPCEAKVRWRAASARAPIQPDEDETTYRRLR